MVSILVYLDDSIWCDLPMVALRRRRLGWRHPSRFSVLNRISVRLFRSLTCSSFSWSDVSEDAYNKKVDGEHNNGALDSNHHLLPGKLDLTFGQKL